MRLPVCIALRRIAFGLLGFVSVLALAQSELEPGGLFTAVLNLDIQVSTGVPALPADPGSPVDPCRFRTIDRRSNLGLCGRGSAVRVHAGSNSYDLAVAMLSHHGITFLGVSLPSPASGDPLMASAVNFIHEVGAGLVLLLLPLHLRNRGVAMPTAATRSFAKRGRRSHG